MGISSLEHALLCTFYLCTSIVKPAKIVREVKGEFRLESTVGLVTNYTISGPKLPAIGLFGVILLNIFLSLLLKPSICRQRKIIFLPLFRMELYRKYQMNELNFIGRLLTDGIVAGSFNMTY